MNTFAPIATPSLNCFATKPNQMKALLAPGVTTASNGYSLPSHVFLKAVKKYLPQLGEVPPAVHALPRVVPPAKYNFFSGKRQRALIKGTIKMNGLGNYMPNVQPHK